MYAPIFLPLFYKRPFVVDVFMGTCNFISEHHVIHDIYDTTHTFSVQQYLVLLFLYEVPTIVILARYNLNH